MAINHHPGMQCLSFQRNTKNKREKERGMAECTSQTTTCATQNNNKKPPSSKTNSTSLPSLTSTKNQEERNKKEKKKKKEKRKKKKKKGIVFFRVDVQFFVKVPTTSLILKGRGLDGQAMTKGNLYVLSPFLLWRGSRIYPEMRKKSWIFGE